MVLAIVASLVLAQASDQAKVSHSNGWGVQHLEFALTRGKLHVFLPDDIREGDTFSGTVVAAPADPKAQLQTDTIEGTVVEIGGAKARGGSFVATVAALGVMNLLVKSANGTVLATVPIQVGPQSQPKTTLWTPPAAQSGKPFTISGPFDGNAANTKCSVGGHPLEVLAETPRSAVVALTQDIPFGPTSMTLSEGGKGTDHKLNVVKLSLSTPRKKLLQGERASVRATLTGLNGLPKSAYPIPLELTNHTPTTVSINVTGNDVCIPVNFKDVRNGTWKGQFAITGITPGDFAISGVFFAVKIHTLKMGLSADDLGAVIGAEIASSEALLAKKRGEKAPDWTINLIKKKIESLNGAKEALPDLDGARTSFDLAMASFSFFEMAGELIDFAADMLGYKDIPLPGLGEVLKGLKVISKGTKAVEIIEKIEKIKDEIDKIKDLKEKADKIKEAKDLLDKVKDELKK